jgi:hypothetical protein
MQNRKMGLAVAGLAVVAAVVLFVVLSGGDDSNDNGASTTVAESTTSTTDGGGSTSTTQEPAADVARIEIKDGQPVGGVQELTFSQGDHIRFVVDSDVDEEVHFHGYDIGKDVKAGGSVSFDVPATIPGVFEVELEHSVVPIAEITVE